MSNRQRAWADSVSLKTMARAAVRQLRAREREDAAVQRELDREREKQQKELGHYQAALQRLRERGDNAAVSEMEAKPAEVKGALHDVETRAANIRTGYDDAAA
jgi:hypothetical protein